MKREIKFSYLLQHGDTGVIQEKILTLDQIEDNKLLELLKSMPRFLIIATRQFTGLHDSKGVEIYEKQTLNKKTTFENNMADKRFQTATEITVGFENGCFVDINSGVSLYEKMKIVSSYRHDVWTDYEIIN